LGILWSGRQKKAGLEVSDVASNASQEIDRGATLMEFAIIMPLLVLLLIGIVESSWLFAQYLDVRHGAREGARLAAVNYPEGTDAPVATPGDNLDALVAETCSRMNLASGITVSFASVGGKADPITVAIEAPSDTLSGLLDWAFGSLTVSSTAVLHAEQPATWATGAGNQSC
jgi:Flp pilus assembly protein TadG